tara:strand:+ start:80 stop:619 length:540 start_codon:yes stop_codon:yes gene_type:complete
MNIKLFEIVIKFLIQTKATKIFYTPSSEIISAVRLYNSTRVNSAKKLNETLTNAEFIQAIRTCNKLIQINTSAANTKCFISKIQLSESTGITLLFHNEDNVKIYTIHRRFIDNVNKFYNIMHFDDEIYKTFKKWWSTKSTTMNTITSDNIEQIISDFLKYNDASNVNLLYMKFVTNCDF